MQFCLTEKIKENYVTNWYRFDFPLIEVKHCDNSAQNPKYYRGETFYNETENIINEIITEKECFSLKDLAINGNHLTEMGYRGKQIGQMLNSLLDLVISEKLKNDHTELSDYVKSLKK